MSLLNRVGYVGPLVRGSNLYVGCVGYVGQNIFYVGHNFYVGCVGQFFFAWIFVSVKNFYVGLCLLSKIFYLLDKIILINCN